MATIAKIKRDVLTGIARARALYAAGLAATGIERDAIIESAFLQMFKSWETFLEDVTVCFMCGRLRCGGGSYIVTFRSETKPCPRSPISREGISESDRT